MEDCKSPGSAFEGSNPSPATIGLGDLGRNFGTSRSEYPLPSGVTLLKEKYTIITKSGYSISNVLVHIIGNRPCIGACRTEAIAITTDGIGMSGEGKDFPAIVAALLARK